MIKILIILMLMCSTAWSAELLIKAKASSSEYGSKVGDIIVVRPDGWTWGDRECLPEYVVVKLPGVTEEYAKKYEEPLIEKTDADKTEVVRNRKFSIPSAEIEKMVKDKESVIQKDASYFISEKSISVEKEAILQAEENLEIISE
jgi:hypothetical protein